MLPMQGLNPRHRLCLSLMLKDVLVIPHQWSKVDDLLLLHTSQFAQQSKVEEVQIMQISITMVCFQHYVLLPQKLLVQIEATSGSRKPPWHGRPRTGLVRVEWYL